jgi:ketosteroid isomerase-like protein
MSQENVRLVRNVYALGLGPAVVDRAFASYLDEEFEVRPPGIYPDGEIFRGRAGVRRWLAALSEAWGEWRFEPERFIDVGDRVVVLVRVVARGGSSGVRLDRKTAHLWTIKDGRATRCDAYLDRSQALEAVGLPAEGR